jgi:nucleotide-binding universal stress UspA family protein
MFKRILVAFKFTPANRSVLEKSIEIAKDHGAELHIFHALDYRLKALDSSDPKLMKINQETKDRFESEVKPLLDGFNHLTFGCLPADPALEICKIARHHKSDLIILGSHQEEKKMSLGRVDYVGMTILEKASCPVMLVPPKT